MEDGWLKYTLSTLLAIAFISFITYEIRSGWKKGFIKMAGKTTGQSSVYRREENPIGYWLVMSFYSLTLVLSSAWFLSSVLKFFNK